MSSRAVISCSCLILAANVASATAQELYVLPNGVVVDMDGNVVAAGLEVVPAEFGESSSVVGANGRVYSNDELRLNARGEVTSRDRKILAASGGAAAAVAPGGAESAEPAQAYRGPGVKFVVGGQSEDGVAKTGVLPIRP